MKIGILGAGLSGISLAYFLQNVKEIDRIDIFEKEQDFGGLCRSFDFNGIYYDIGPHIIFSKDREILKLMTDFLGENVNKLKRSNKIFFKGNFVKYPFENELSALSDEDKMYCLETFLNNPYKNYVPHNLLQYFLIMFGEGITNCYLRPYNEKIWKFDPVLLNTGMVERIPKPPREDIIKSANGFATEGYVHQLYFYYPQDGGIASLVKAFVNRFSEKINTILNSTVSEVWKFDNRWIVKDSKGDEKKYNLIISTIPLQALTKAMGNITPHSVRFAVDDLKYNSIAICVLNLKKDNLGDNFSILIPDKKVIFHRLSKLNFLMKDSRRKENSALLLVEITFRKDDPVSKMSDFDIALEVLNDLEKLRFIDRKDDCDSYEIKRFEYAYVIYDLNHKKNMEIIKDFYEKELQLILCGRFGEFEYLNMDAAIRNSFEKANKVMELI